MKKIYKAPITETCQYPSDIMLVKESIPNNDPILGKEREDDVEMPPEPEDHWSKGLW